MEMWDKLYSISMDVQPRVYVSFFITYIDTHTYIIHPLIDMIDRLSDLSAFSIQQHKWISTFKYMGFSQVFEWGKRTENGRCKADSSP